MTIPKLPAASAALFVMLGCVGHSAPMSYEAALKLAETSAPSLVAKAFDVAAARSGAVAAGRLPDPKLGFGVEGFPVSGPFAGHPARDDFSDARVSLIQEVPSGAKRRAARDRAAADIGAAQADQLVEARAVRLACAIAWIDLYYAERRLDALSEIERVLSSMRQAAPSQLQSGNSRPAQTLEAQQLTASLADRRADLTAQVARDRAELGRWTGDVEAEVTGDVPVIAVDATALRLALDRQPALIVYDAMARKADADLEAARADKHPDWSWELGYQHRDPRFGDMVSLGGSVSLPLFASTRQDPIIAARVAAVGRIRLEREASRRTLNAALAGDLADHLMHHERLARAEQTLAPLAKRRVDLETASYSAGTASLADVLQSLLALAEARIDTVNRQADVTRDAARLTLTYEASDQ